MKKKSYRRTIFIGDVHGCYEELKLLIDKLKINKDDRVILLGDLINRGPYPEEVVSFVYENKFECLMGNHEYEYLLKYKNNNNYQKLYQNLGKELHNWIKNRPYYIQDKNFIAVHAGIVPNFPLNKTPPNILLFVRKWNPNPGHSINGHSINGKPWYEFYNGKKTIIYGHWAKQGLRIRSNTIGTDSGCVYGKFLTAFILEEKKIVQIKAKEVYYIPPSLRK